MPDLLAQALALPGLGWLFATIIAAGLVRGFAGFGSALIIMPVASSVLSPFAAIAFLTVLDLFGPVPLLGRAFRQADRRDVARLLAGVTVVMPLGLFLLGYIPGDVFGWIVSVVVLVLLVLLVAGWRYNGQLSPAMTVGVGGLGGFLAGISGLAGPPVIMLYMASRLPVAVIRANFLLFLLGIDVLMLGMLAVVGRLDSTAVVIALVLLAPYMLANMIGARLFNPGAEPVFRAVAYVIIATSAVLGLPIWIS